MGQRTVVVTITDGGQEGLLMLIDMLNVLESQAKDRAVLVPDWSIPVCQIRDALKQLTSGKERITYASEEEWPANDR